MREKGREKTPGSGRKKGTPNKSTKKRKAVAEKALSEGITPLEVMLGAMRSLWNLARATKEAAERVTLEAQASAIAKDAAPFVHPRLAAVEHSGDLTHTHEHITREEARRDVEESFADVAGDTEESDTVVH